jgi:hypothetical protein
MEPDATPGAGSAKQTMKAVVRDRYGSPDVLELQEIERPELTDDGVLSGSDGRVQHEECRHRPIARRGSRHRLHQ